MAENFSGQKPGTPSETQDAKRFRLVRNWVENVEYDSKKILKKASTPTNITKKFAGRMDLVMHFLAGAAVSANIGETAADMTSLIVEIGDKFKRLAKQVGGVPPRTGFDKVDLAWGLRGSELQNAFDTSEKNARKLARKFESGQFKLSKYQDWYKKPDSILY